MRHTLGAILLDRYLRLSVSECLCQKFGYDDQRVISRRGSRPRKKVSRGPLHHSITACMVDYSIDVLWWRLQFISVIRRHLHCILNLSNEN